MKSFIRTAFAALVLGYLISGCAPSQIAKTPDQIAEVAHPVSQEQAAVSKPLPADGAIVPEPARASDDLVEMIGVATHWGFRNTIYNSKWDELQKRLGEIGIRYIRDGLDPRMDELWKMYGVRGIVIVGPTMSWEKFTEQWKSKKHLVAAIEGPNEVNGGWAKAGYVYKEKVWPEGPKLFQEDLYKCIKDNPELKDIPVIDLSTAYKGFSRELAPLRSFDYANAHSYAGGDIPSRSLDFKDSYLMLGPGAALPPMVATESGYHTCLGNSKVIAGAQSGVSHLAHKKYISRHVAEYFNAGFKWTVIYEFAAGRPNKAEQEDPEAAFGLLMPDASPKPAYFALKDLISVISESNWDSSSGKWIRPAAYQPQALAFALEGAPETLHHTLLQRSDGTFQLLLWNEVPSFDLRAKKDIANKEVPIRLILNNKAERITVTYLGPDAKSAEKFESVKEVDLKVPDEVVVVGITLAEALKPAVVKQPAGADVKSGATSVELSWQSSPDAAAYWISMNRRNLGCAQVGSDGRATFRMGGLIPATTYPFEITAVAADGGVSAPLKVPATTVNAFPDLVVRSLKTVPESPKEGDAVKFVAVIENCGNAPVEEGVTVGTKFSVDGKTVCWCDNIKGPMEPGQKVEVKPNSGPTGETSWKLAKGTHQVSAFVDDVNRIIESNEANNRLTIKIGTGAGPDLVVKDLKVKQAQKGKPLVAEVIVENRGTEAVPKGTSVSANIARIDVKPPKTLGFNLDKEGVPAGGTITLTVKCEGDFEPGKIKVRATVDDVDRIPETDDANNSAEFDVDIGG